MCVIGLYGHMIILIYTYRLHYSDEKLVLWTYIGDSQTWVEYSRCALFSLSGATEPMKSIRKCKLHMPNNLNQAQVFWIFEIGTQPRSDREGYPQCTPVQELNSLLQTHSICSCLLPPVLPPTCPKEPVISQRSIHIPDFTVDRSLSSLSGDWGGEGCANTDACVVQGEVYHRFRVPTGDRVVLRTGACRGGGGWFSRCS